MRRWSFWVTSLALLVPAGCATSPYPPGEGPRVTPNDKEWRRKSVPAPPLYMQFTSGSGKRWTMATPLYWHVEGAESESRHFIPFASWSVDRPAQVERGHVLNYFWGDRPESSYRVGFPFYWSFQGPESKTTLYGPVYRTEAAANHKRRLVVMPWLYSRETDETGYDYWGVLGRLVGYEKQRFGGERKERLWLFFVFHIDTV